jgi:hypothetical protein
MGLGRVFTFRTTAPAFPERASESDFRKEWNRKIAEDKLTRKSDPGYPRAIANKQSYTVDRGDKRG